MFEHLTEHGPGVHDVATWAFVLKGPGGIYLKAGRYQEALKIHQECRDIHESIGDRRGLARSYGNLGPIYDRLGSYDPAITSFEKALELAKECGDLDLAVRIVSRGITRVYFKHGEYRDDDSGGHLDPRPRSPDSKTSRHRIDLVGRSSTKDQRARMQFA